MNCSKYRGGEVGDHIETGHAQSHETGTLLALRTSPDGETRSSGMVGSGVRAKDVQGVAMRVNRDCEVESGRVLE